MISPEEQRTVHSFPEYIERELMVVGDGRLFGSSMNFSVHSAIEAE
jgi:hypothetical protein